MLMIGGEVVNDYYSIAKVAYQANKAFSESNFDFSHKGWEDETDEVREGFVHAVIRIFNNPKISPIEMHEAWKKDKIEQGWRYGESKDIKGRTHPCIAPYDKLPLFERLKDDLFINIVKTFI